MRGRVLDAEAIQKLRSLGWTNRKIAEHLNVPVQSVAASHHRDNGWDDDPSLRKRWERKLPAMKAAIREAALL